MGDSVPYPAVHDELQTYLITLEKAEHLCRFDRLGPSLELQFPMQQLVNTKRLEIGGPSFPFAQINTQSCRNSTLYYIIQGQLAL